MVREYNILDFESLKDVFDRNINLKYDNEKGNALFKIDYIDNVIRKNAALSEFRHIRGCRLTLCCKHRYIYLLFDNDRTLIVRNQENCLSLLENVIFGHDVHMFNSEILNAGYEYKTVDFNNDDLKEVLRANDFGLEVCSLFDRKYKEETVGSLFQELFPILIYHNYRRSKKITHTCYFWEYLNQNIENINKILESEYDKSRKSIHFDGKCRFCDKEGLDNVMQHIYDEHISRRSGKLPFFGNICSYCREKLRDDNAIKKHLINKHPLSLLAYLYLTTDDKSIKSHLLDVEFKNLGLSIVQVKKQLPFSLSNFTSRPENTNQDIFTLISKAEKAISKKDSNFYLITEDEKVCPECKKLFYDQLVLIKHFIQDHPTKLE